MEPGPRRHRQHRAARHGDGPLAARTASGDDDILEFAGLERFAHLELRHYSSGMAARLAYAVAFRAVREVLILDEIFAVGDAGFKERCQARYRQMHRAGHSMLLVSHDPARSPCSATAHSSSTAAASSSTAPHRRSPIAICRLF